MDLISMNSENGVPSSKTIPQTNNNGSDFLKRMRSVSTEEEDFLSPKLLKPHYSDVMQQGSSSLLSLSTGPQTKMLSFSNPGSESHSLTKNGGFGQTSEFFHHAYTVNSGYGSGVQAAVMGGGLFTASQWAELQHQALVYKYIQANLEVPPGLLLGLKRPVSPFLLPGLHSGSYSYTPNSWGWGGSFRLGFSGNSTDPEPGRCRRTDGKKWRCARDAVPEQKYCERHLNRGRHRSRKLVESQTVPTMGPTAAATSASLISGGGVASGIIVLPNQPKGLQPHAGGINPSTDHGKFQRIISDHQGPSQDSNPKDSIFSVPKRHITTEEEPSHSHFGLVPSDSLLNPSLKTSYTNYNPTTFIHQSDRATWPDEPNPDWTQLSMSIPTSTSPQEKITLSPLSLSHEPVPWGGSVGGPLGEALLSNGNGLWFGSSPTGVLQKADFRSLSNSSSGSSPRGERNKMDGDGGLGDDVFGPSLTTSMFLPSL